MRAQAPARAKQVEKDGGVVVAQGRSEALELEPGKSFERQISSGETHSYFVRCDARQFIQTDLEQRGSNVGVDLFGTDNQLILSLNNVDDMEGTERVPVLADVAGGKITNTSRSAASSALGSQPSSPVLQPLIVAHEIVSVASASVITVLRSELSGRRSAPKAIAVLADPVFDRDDAELNCHGTQPKSLRHRQGPRCLRLA